MMENNFFFGFENSTIGFPIPWLVKITLDTTQIWLKLQEIWLETQKGQNDPCQDQWSKWPVIVLLGRRCNIWQSINAIIEKLWVDEDISVVSVKTVSSSSCKSLLFGIIVKVMHPGSKLVRVSKFLDMGVRVRGFFRDPPFAIFLH